MRGLERIHAGVKRLLLLSDSSSRKNPVHKSDSAIFKLKEVTALHVVMDRSSI